MKTEAIFSRMTRSTLLILALLTGWQGVAVASPVTTAELLTESRVQQQQAEVSAFLSRDAVRQQLTARGVNVDDAMERVAALSPEELATLHQQIDELPAGEGVLETALFLLVIFMLLDIAGVTDIFPSL